MTKTTRDDGLTRRGVLRRVLGGALGVLAVPMMAAMGRDAWADDPPAPKKKASKKKAGAKKKAGKKKAAKKKKGAKKKRGAGKKKTKKKAAAKKRAAR